MTADELRALWSGRDGRYMNLRGQVPVQIAADIRAWRLVEVDQVPARSRVALRNEIARWVPPLGKDSRR